jgi:hypothetical protein
MPQERLPMRKIRDVLRLKAGGSSPRASASARRLSGNVSAGRGVRV